MIHWRSLKEQVQLFEKMVARLQSPDINAWEWQKLTPQLLSLSTDIMQNAGRENAGETQRGILTRAAGAFDTAITLMKREGNDSNDIKALVRRRNDLLAMAGEGVQREREWHEHVRRRETSFLYKIISHFGTGDSDRGQNHASR